MIINPYIYGGAGLLLDNNTDIGIAFSVRKLRTAYTGYCMRVRRENDNAEQDIGFDANGLLDESAIRTFCGANYGRVVKFYDQTGNGNDLYQSTGTAQPYIWHNTNQYYYTVNGKPTVYFITHVLNLTTSYACTNYTCFSVFRRIGGYDGLQFKSAAHSRTIYFQFGAGGYSMHLYSGFRKNNSSIEAAGQGLTISKEVSSVISARYNGSNITYTGTVGGYAGSTNFSDMGYSGLTGGSARGGLSELLLFPLDKTIDSIESNINTYYTIF